MNLWRWVAVLLFGYVLARPVSANSILVPVLAGMGALAVGAILLARRRIVAPLVPAALTTFIFAVIGLSVNPTNPGFVGALLVFVAAPLLYWLIVAAVDERMLRMAFSAAAVVTVFVGSTIAIYVAQETGSLPAILPSWLLEQYGAGFGEGDYTEVRFYGLSTLVATGPMWIASLLVARDSLLPPWWLRAVAAVAATTGTLAAGRRALAVVLVLAPVLAWLLTFLLTPRGMPRMRPERTRVLVLGGSAVLVAAFAPGSPFGGVLGSAWGSVLSYVTGRPVAGSASSDDLLRTLQADKLLDAWAESPVFGHGFGATIQGFWRSQEEPWRWELQYHALLFQTGIVGALLIVLGALLTLNAVLRAARARPDLVPSLVVACMAATGMLIANASNPYLQAPGYVWAIFLPVAVANVMLSSGGGKHPGPAPQRRLRGPWPPADHPAPDGPASQGPPEEDLVAVRAPDRPAEPMTQKIPRRTPS
ncbi:MAG TPA: hypothetical protein VD814_04530 [Nocardioides sp.]|nr:hypothetical protein [Nocardioides sp.]